MGGVVLGEGRVRAITDELERVARCRAVAGEVDDRVAIALPDDEHEGVVARVAGEHVGTALPVKRVVAGIAEQAVGEGIAGAAQVPGSLLHQGFHVRR